MGRANEPLPRRPVVDDRHKRTSQRQCRQCVLKRWRNKSSDGGFRGQTLGAGTLHTFLHSLQIPVKKSVKSLFFLVLAAGSNKMFSLPLISTLSFQDFLKKKTKKNPNQTSGPDASPDRLLHAQSHRDIPVSMETLDNIPFMLRWQMVLIITSLFIRVVCLFTPRAGCFFFCFFFKLTPSTSRFQLFLNADFVL